MREVSLLMKFNLTTLQIYFKQGRKFKLFCQIGLKYRKIVFKYLKYILNTYGLVSARSPSEERKKKVTGLNRVYK